MKPYAQYMIKSFKHNGRMHRMWLTNWRVPDELLADEHAIESMIVLINDQTRIREADGREWTSKVPSVAFFLPGQWYNVIALLEENGIRYYCNAASPPYDNEEERTLTYIDYDLDVIRFADGNVQIVDQEEYAAHRVSMCYFATLEEKIEDGLNLLLRRIKDGKAPFRDDLVVKYYRDWKTAEKR